MIDRAATLLAALAERGARDEALASLSTRLSGSNPSRVADAIAEALETIDAHGIVEKDLWAISTIVAACVAAVLATYGLSAQFALLKPFQLPGLHVIPLLALPFAAWVIFDLIQRRRLQRSRLLLMLMLPLARVGVPAELSLDTARWILEMDRNAPDDWFADQTLSGTDPERQRLVLSSLTAGAPNIGGGVFRQLVGPVLLASFVVLSFWSLHFLSLGAHMLSPWFER